MVLPDLAGHLLRVGRDDRVGVEDPREPGCRTRASRDRRWWRTPSTRRASARTPPRPRRRGRRSAWPAGRWSGCRTRAARRGRGRRRGRRPCPGRPGQLVDVGTAAGGRLRLGEVQRRHPEQPVGADQLVQLAPGCGRSRRGSAAPSGPAKRSSAVAACSSVTWPSSLDQRRTAAARRGCARRSGRRPGRPVASACHGVVGSTSPSTTGANGTGRCAARPQRSRTAHRSSP